MCNKQHRVCVPVPDQKPIPEFFVYYGKHSMASNNKVLESLTREDVSHLSEAERDFFDYWQEERFNIHSGSCFGERPTQEEECKGVLAMKAYD